MRKIKGYIRRKPEPNDDVEQMSELLYKLNEIRDNEPKPDLAKGVGEVVKLVSDLTEIKGNIEETVDTKLSEVDDAVEQLKATVEEVKTIKKGEEGYTPVKGVDYFDGEPGLPGKDADEEKIFSRLEKKIPRPLDEKKLKKSILKEIPVTKADLKIIREKVEVDPMAVIDKIMALPEEARKKLKFKEENIDGLSQTIRAMQSQLGRGYLHGGGISNITGLIEAGTNVTIDGSGTNTEPYIINSSGGGSTLTVETQDGVTTVANVNTIKVTDGTLTDEGGGVVSIDTGGGTSGLEIDVTTIASGTTTRILYDNAGVLGEYAISGTGNVAMTDTPVFTTRIETPVVRATTSGGLLLEASNGTDVGLLGVANTANIEWYGSHNFNTATQDTIAGFLGSSKTLSSLTTTTYPTLTELSYVKGVTSSIQTQLNGKASTAQVFDWNPFFNGSIPNGDYRIIINCSFAGTINEITTRSVSGTGTLTGKVNTTALGGTANSVSSSEQSQTHSSSNTFSAGDDIVITMSSVSSLLDMSVKIKYTRTLA